MCGVFGLINERPNYIITLSFTSLSKPFSSFMSSLLSFLSLELVTSLSTSAELVQLSGGGYTLHNKKL